MLKQQNTSGEYLSYLIRLWYAWDEEGRQVWRASAQTPGSLEARKFADLEALVTFLRAQTEKGQEQESAPPS